MFQVNKQIKLEVLGPLVSLSNVVVDWETSGNEKWGELGKIAIGVANTRAVPCRIFQTTLRKASFLTSLRQILLSTGKLVYSRIFLSASKKGH